jgi:hypothetical protein
VANAAKVSKYVDGVVQLLTSSKEEVEEALKLIADGVSNPSTSLAMRLLALRRYLRIGQARVVAQWAWTAEQTAQKMSSGDGKLLYELAATTQRAFTQQNQGYQLAISPLRSLSRQIELWITNATVQSSSAKLLADMDAELSGPEYADVPSPANVAKFRRVLSHARVVPEPTSAAPGTSDHGQGHAVDFVVMRGRHKIAGTETASIPRRWKRDGWEQKLFAAIEECNRQQRESTPGRVAILSGPLKRPYEPWHWVLKWEEVRTS